MGDMFGGGNDGFGEMQSSQPAFPSFIAYEDSIITIGLEFKRDPMANNTHTLTSKFKNKTGANLSGVSMQAAALKYMTLKMKPASGTSLGPNGSDLSQEMVIVNSEEGKKPISLKLKINYT